MNVDIDQVAIANVERVQAKLEELTRKLMKLEAEANATPDRARYLVSEMQIVAGEIRSEWRNIQTDLDELRCHRTEQQFTVLDDLSLMVGGFPGPTQRAVRILDRVLRITKEKSNSPSEPDQDPNTTSPLHGDLGPDNQESATSQDASVANGTGQNWFNKPVSLESAVKAGRAERVKLRSALKRTDGYSQVLFAQFAGVTDAQWKDWPRGVHRDGYEVDRKIRTAADRWLAGERAVK